MPRLEVVDAEGWILGLAVVAKGKVVWSRPGTHAPFGMFEFGSDMLGLSVGGCEGC
jgi:hypothetical protein